MNFSVGVAASTSPKSISLFCWPKRRKNKQRWRVQRFLIACEYAFKTKRRARTTTWLIFTVYGCSEQRENNLYGSNWTRSVITNVFFYLWQRGFFPWSLYYFVNENEQLMLDQCASMTWFKCFKYFTRVFQLICLVCQGRYFDNLVLSVSFFHARIFGCYGRSMVVEIFVLFTKKLRRHSK